MANLRRIVAIGSVVVVASQAAGAPEFVGIGHLAGAAEDSAAFGISDDGSLVVGSAVSDDGPRAVIWRRDSGLVDLGVPPGWETSVARNVSADGNTVVGFLGRSSAPLSQAFRWTEGEGLVELGWLQTNASGSEAFAVSADGSLIAGDSRGPFASRAVLWDETGITNLNGSEASFTTARAISRVGDLVVGQSDQGAYRWTEETGVTPLGGVAANAVSDDNQIIAGVGLSVSGEWEAAYWDATLEAFPLGDLPGGEARSVASGTNHDGSIIIGTGSTDLGDEAFIWDPRTGMRNLRTVLTNEYGLDLNGWTLTSATDITPNGHTIIGVGINAQGMAEGWVATIPEPDTLWGLLAGAFVIIRSRRAT